MLLCLFAATWMSALTSLILSRPQTILYAIGGVQLGNVKTWSNFFGVIVGHVTQHVFSSLSENGMPTPASKCPMHSILHLSFLFMIPSEYPVLTGYDEKKGKKQNNSLCLVKPWTMGFTGIRPTLGSTSCGPLF